MRTLFITFIMLISFNLFSQDCVNCAGDGSSKSPKNIELELERSQLRDDFRVKMCAAVEDGNFAELGVYITELENRSFGKRKAELSDIYYNFKCKQSRTLLQAAIYFGSILSVGEPTDLMKVVMGGLMGDRSKSDSSKKLIRALNEDIYRGNLVEKLSLRDWIKLGKEGADATTDYAWNEITKFIGVIDNLYGRHV